MSRRIVVQFSLAIVIGILALFAWQQYKPHAETLEEVIDKWISTSAPVWWDIASPINETDLHIEGELAPEWDQFVLQAKTNQIKYNLLVARDAQPDVELKERYTTNAIERSPNAYQPPSSFYALTDAIIRNSDLFEGLRNDVLLLAIEKALRHADIPRLLDYSNADITAPELREKIQHYVAFLRLRKRSNSEYREALSFLFSHSLTKEGVSLACVHVQNFLLNYKDPNGEFLDNLLSRFSFELTDRTDISTEEQRILEAANYGHQFHEIYQAIKEAVIENFDTEYRYEELVAPIFHRLSLDTFEEAVLGCVLENQYGQQVLSQMPYLFEYLRYNKNVDTDSYFSSIIKGITSDIDSVHVPPLLWDLWIGFDPTRSPLFESLREQIKNYLSDYSRPTNNELRISGAFNRIALAHTLRSPSPSEVELQKAILDQGNARNLPILNAILSFYRNERTSAFDQVGEFNELQVKSSDYSQEIREIALENGDEALVDEINRSIDLNLGMYLNYGDESIFDQLNNLAFVTLTRPTEESLYRGRLEAIMSLSRNQFTHLRCQQLLALGEENWPELIEHSRELISMRPSEPGNYYTLGIACFEADQLTESEQAFENFLSFGMRYWMTRRAERFLGDIERKLTADGFEN